MQLSQRMSVLVGLLASLAAAPLSAQGPRQTQPFPTVASLPLAGVAFADSTPSSGNYWLEGGALGALGGVVVASLYNGLVCGGDSSGCDSGRSILVGLVGGFVVGALIGGGIKKG